MARRKSDLGLRPAVTTLSPEELQAGDRLLDRAAGEMGGTRKRRSSERAVIRSERTAARHQGLARRAVRNRQAGARQSQLSVKRGVRIREADARYAHPAPRYPERRRAG